MSGYLLAPLAGAFVAASISYSLRHDIHADSVALAQSLREARDRLRESDQELHTGKSAEQRSREKVRPPAYVRREQPSFGEEIKARWNVSTHSCPQHVRAGACQCHKSQSTSRLTFASPPTSFLQEHLTHFVQRAAELEWHDVAGRAYNRLKGVTEDHVAPALHDAADAAGSAKEDLLSGSLRPAAATAVQSIKSKVDPRLAQPNTYYLGQGTSLR